MGLNYARITPFGAGHEVANARENGHLNYVRHLVAGKGLPALGPVAGNDQSYQPPLYYIVATAYSKIIGLRSAQHDPALDIKLRSLGVIFALFTIYGIYQMAFLHTKDQTMGVLAAGCVGLSPMFCTTAGSVSNAVAGACFSTWALVNLLSVRPKLQQMIWAGIFTGLAFDTHPMAAMLLLGWAFMFVRAIAPRKATAAGFTIAILISLPVALRNYSAFGDPFGWGVQHLGSQPFDLAAFVQVTLKSGIGTFGSNTVFLSNYFYAPYLLVTVGAAVVGIFELERSGFKRSVFLRFVVTMTVAWYTILNLHHFSPSADVLLIAAPLWGILCASGWRKILPNDRAFQVFAALILIGFVLLNAYVFNLLPGRFADIAALGSYLT